MSVPFIVRVRMMSKAQESSVEVRSMAPSDIGAVMSLNEHLGGRVKFTHYAELFGHEPADKLGYSFVAVVRGRVVGFVIASTMYLYVPLTKVCLIHSLAVHPEHHQMHIGSTLVEQVLNKCQAEGVDTVRALVSEVDAALQRFIERLGFRRGELLNYDRTIESQRG